MGGRVLETDGQVDAVTDSVARKLFLIIAAVLALGVPFWVGGWGLLWAVLLAGIGVAVVVVVLRLLFR